MHLLLEKSGGLDLDVVDDGDDVVVVLVAVAVAVAAHGHDHGGDVVALHLCYCYWYWWYCSSFLLPSNNRLSKPFLVCLLFVCCKRKRRVRVIVFMLLAM